MVFHEGFLGPKLSVLTKFRLIYDPNCLLHETIAVTQKLGCGVESAPFPYENHEQRIRANPIKPFWPLFTNFRNI
jgi:hypothetical protein